MGKLAQVHVGCLLSRRARRNPVYYDIPEKHPPVRLYNAHGAFGPRAGHLTTEHLLQHTAWGNGKAGAGERYIFCLGLEVEH